MEKLAILLFDMLLWGGYLLIAILAALLIQLVSYRIFHKNLYRWFINKFIISQL